MFSYTVSPGTQLTAAQTARWVSPPAVVTAWTSDSETFVPETVMKMARTPVPMEANGEVALFAIDCTVVRFTTHVGGLIAYRSAEVMLFSGVDDRLPVGMSL